MTTDNEPLIRRASICIRDSPDAAVEYGHNASCYKHSKSVVRMGPCVGDTLTGSGIGLPEVHAPIARDGDAVAYSAAPQEGTRRRG